MPIYVSSGSGSTTPPPEQVHRAVCVDVVEKLAVQTRFGIKDKVQLRWHLEMLNPETDKPFMVVRDYNATLHPNSTLRAELERWRGKPFAADELTSFDVEKLIGANCQIQIVHQPTNEGGVWAAVQAIMPADKSVPAMAVSEDYVRVKDKTDVPPSVAPAQIDDDIPF